MVKDGTERRKKHATPQGSVTRLFLLHSSTFGGGNEKYLHCDRLRITLHCSEPVTLVYLEYGMLKDWPQPLLRNQGALSKKEQQKLIQSRVVVCGCGGLGGLVIENLARIGVGRLRIVDPDSFTNSNLNRQLGATLTTMGDNKAEVMARRIREINGSCRVEAVPHDFREMDVLADMEVGVDCLDTSDARLELADQCNEKQIPLVHGAVNGWYGQVGVQPAGGDLVHRLYGNKQERGEPIPVLSFTATLVASLQAAETVKILIGRPSRLINDWLTIDLRSGDFDYSGQQDTYQ